ncbi:MAG TPA: hypothetical protein VEZ46_01755 [Mycobacteriales bacterium]|jgi:hypothetical protein|nr:hypothetical protein [Mycobacteriales bacterium]
MRKNTKLAAVVVTAAGTLAATMLALPAEARPSSPNKVYTASLDALNTHISGSAARGTATVAVTGDRVDVAIDVAGVSPGTLHPQHIHAGPECATMADAGSDGILDVIDGLPKYGNILISLDDTFADPTDASLGFPVASADGTYSYRASGSKSHFQDELDQALKAGTRHVVIHGVDPATPLPSTVKSLPGLPAWATLPVACGELVQH